jgi:hypothetical protein
MVVGSPHVIVAQGLEAIGRRIEALRVALGIHDAADLLDLLDDVADRLADRAAAGDVRTSVMDSYSMCRADAWAAADEFDTTEPLASIPRSDPLEPDQGIEDSPSIQSADLGGTGEGRYHGIIG